MPPRKDLTGQTFGRLTATKRIDKNGRAYYVCQCSCGNVCEVFHSNLTQGFSKSCGCLSREIAADRVRTHGMSQSKLYRVLKAMKDRCMLKSCKAYKNYGGRGITICDEWLGENGFQNFYNWAMANGYIEGLTIDRINNDGNYEPSNCRWVDRITQGNNTRKNRFITYGGLRMTIAQWERYLNLHSRTISNRIRYGWTDEECIEGRKKH